MDALRIREFFFKSNNELSNSSDSTREDSLSSNKGQWRKKWDVDLISIPQLQRGVIQFWKLWLNVHVDGSVLDEVVSLVVSLD